MQISHSKLATWRRCRRKFWFSYGLNFAEPSNVGRKVGTIGHSTLALWYKSDMSEGVQKLLLQAAVDQAKADDIPDKDITRLTNALKRYFVFSWENDQDWEILESEYHFSFYFPPSWFHGYIDLVARDSNGDVFGVEHKFNQIVTTQHLALDPQSSIYLIGGEKYEMKYILYNIVRVKDGPTAYANPVVREKVTRSPEFQEMLKWDLATQINELEAWEKNPRKALISYPNPTHTCSWDCSFRDACIQFSEGGDLSKLNELDKKAPRDDELEQKVDDGE